MDRTALSKIAVVRCYCGLTAATARPAASKIGLSFHIITD
jgi:hypothetical protein